MATGIMSNDMARRETHSGSYERLASVSAFLAAAAGLLYSVAFVLLKDPLLYSLFLMLGGLFSVVVMVGLYERLHATNPGFALLALVLGAVSTLGAAVHGGYDLSNAVNAPKSDPLAAANLPSQLDPRGLLTFGIAGLAVFFFSWLMTHTTTFPHGLGYLGYLLAVLMVVIYFVRLIILDPNANPLIPLALALTGLIVNPLWYAWVGMSLMRGEQPQSGVLNPTSQ